MGGGLKNLSGGYLPPAMLRQRMGGAGIRLHSTLLKRSPMTVRLAARKKAADGRLAGACLEDQRSGDGRPASRVPLCWRGP